jgi:hypothetical protein
MFKPKSKLKENEYIEYTDEVVNNIMNVLPSIDKETVKSAVNKSMNNNFDLYIKKKEQEENIKIQEFIKDTFYQMQYNYYKNSKIKEIATENDINAIINNFENLINEELYEIGRYNKINLSSIGEQYIINNSIYYIRTNKFCEEKIENKNGEYKSEWRRYVIFKDLKIDESPYMLEIQKVYSDGSGKLGWFSIIHLNKE